MEIVNHVEMEKCDIYGWAKETKIQLGVSLSTRYRLLKMIVSSDEELTKKDLAHLKYKNRIND